MKVTREEEILLRGLKSPSQRGGRLPAFYREEVDKIRQDTRSIEEIAEHWGVAVHTIRRVQGRGAFAAVPYIPRDEVDRATKYPDYADAAQRYLDGYKPMGRPFASGRGPLTIVEEVAILTDKRPAREIAHSFGLKTSYVQRMKRELMYLEDVDVTTLGNIRADTRDHATIAKAHKVPVHIVERVKNEQDEGA